MSSAQPVLDALKRFVRDSEKEGLKVIAWPTCDPDFHIGGIQTDQDYLLLFGVDRQEREGMLVIPASSLSLQMRCVPADDEQKSIGFITANGVGGTPGQ